MDLTKDAQTALAAIKNEVQQTNEYQEHLSSQNKRLQNAMAAIESRMAGAAGFTSSDFTTIIAQKITRYLSTRIQNQPYISYQSQSNITGDEALYLLKDY